MRLCSLVVFVVCCRCLQVARLLSVCVEGLTVVCYLLFVLCGLWFVVCCCVVAVCYSCTVLFVDVVVCSLLCFLFVCLFV